MIEKLDPKPPVHHPPSRESIIDDARRRHPNIEVPPMPKLGHKNVIAKVRAAFYGAAALALLPVYNLLANLLGLPTITPEELDMLWQLGINAYAALAAFIVAALAWLKSPDENDKPVPVG